MEGKSRPPAVELWTVQASRVAAWIVACLVVFPYFYHLVKGTDGYLTILTDDFYYYAIVADNVLRTGQMTFDGTHATNGFHPLFFAVLMGIRAVTGGMGNTFFAVLGALMLASSIATFELVLRLGRSLSAPDSISAPVAVIACLQAARMASWGMETILAVPLHVAFLLVLARGATWTLRRALGLGLLASLLVLARLDSVILVGFALIAWAELFWPTWRARLVALGAFAAGGVLLPLYLAANRIVFGGFMPLSAEAKQMSTSFGFNAMLPANLVGDQLGLLGLVSSLAGILFIAFRPAVLRIREGSGVAAVLALGFPYVFFVVYGLRSDWNLFQWYLYPWIPAVAVAWLLIGSHLARKLRPRYVLAAGAAVVLVGIAAAGMPVGRRAFGWRPEAMSLYHHARALEPFAQAHPGIYAMGDRAGLTAWFLRQPVLQLEGLVADRALLEHIRQQDPLDSVLESYGVSYLIVSVYEPIEQVNGCYEVVAPHPRQSGLRSPRMRGSFCQEPVFHLTSPRGNGPGDVFTYVFRVRSESRQPSDSTSR